MKPYKIAVLGASLLLAGCSQAQAATTPPAQQAAGWHATCTTNSSGVCSIANTTGVNPDAVTITVRQSVTGYVRTSTATTISLQFLQQAKTAAFVGAVSFDVHVDYTPVSPTTVPTTTPATTSPTPAGFPDASTTGVPAGTALTAYTGPETVPANTVIDGKDVHGCLVIGGTGVVIRNSKIHGDCFYVIDNYAHPGTPLTVQDSEVFCDRNGAAMSGTGIGEEDVTAVRVDVHSCENGFDINHAFTVQDSYVHDLFQSDQAHSDGAQVSDAGHDVKFLHNRIYSGGSYNGTIVNGTSSIITPRASVGGASNVTIDGNLFSGGAYSLYCVQAGPGTNFRVTNNRFSTLWASKGGVFGPWTDCEDETHSGNAWYESGQPLD